LYCNIVTFFRFLATGDQVSSIAFAHRIGESRVYKIIKETCAVTMNFLGPRYLKPLKEEDWKKITAGFWNCWNFPNCLDAIDKHFLIKAPPNSGSLYFNYKKTFSVVLLAACDHEYKFTIDRLWCLWQRK